MSSPSKDFAAETKPPASSYGQILKSSTILGGAQGLNYLVAMASVKVVAVLLGPSGVGLIGIYRSLIAMLGTVAALGIPSSGVRQVAEAVAAGDPIQTAQTCRTMMRITWLTGLLGWLLTAALAYPLSHWSFGNTNHASAIILLGSVVFLTSVSGGQTAMIQGMRRIGDLARLQILSMLVGTGISVALYLWLREQGIVPALIASAVISLASTWWFAAKIPLTGIPKGERNTWHGAEPLLKLGLAFASTAILSAVVAYLIRSLIVRDFGIEANGIFQSAWAISGMFAGFILSAMGTDFYPRLTGVSHDHAEMNRIVNEQTEIAVLLALPGLLGTLVFAPWLMRLFYSSAFLPGAELLPWFVLGAFFKVISWPMGFIILAKGKTRWFIISEILFNLLLFGATYVFLNYSGVAGAAYAFSTLYALQIIAMLVVSKILSDFSWTTRTIKLLLISAMVIMIAFLLQNFSRDVITKQIGSLLFAISVMISLRGIAKRLGSTNKWISRFLALPGASFILGVNAK